MVAPLRIQLFLFVLCGATAEQGDEYQSGMYPKEVEHCISFQQGQYWQPQLEALHPRLCTHLYLDMKY